MLLMFAISSHGQFFRIKYNKDCNQMARLYQQKVEYDRYIWFLKNQSLQQKKNSHQELFVMSWTSYMFWKWILHSMHGTNKDSPFQSMIQSQYLQQEKAYQYSCIQSKNSLHAIMEFVGNCKNSMKFCTYQRTFICLVVHRIMIIHQLNMVS